MAEMSRPFWDDSIDLSENRKSLDSLEVQPVVPQAEIQSTQQQPDNGTAPVQASGSDNQAIDYDG
jgi:hypothetical protein